MLVAHDGPCDAVAGDEGYKAGHEGEHSEGTTPHRTLLRLQILSNISPMLHLVVLKAVILGLKELKTVVGLDHHVLEECCAHISYRLVLTKVSIWVMWLVIGLPVNVDARILELGLHAKGLIDVFSVLA